ncbi:hypothetical protein HDU67_002746 [Dinochytrium kinnereticum]|nr:hypothetical protein HDU67_002746 [Dinochytrium kinnereticum]
MASLLLSVLLACSALIPMVLAQQPVQTPFGSPFTIASAATVVFPDGLTLTWNGPPVVLTVTTVPSSTAAPNNWINLSGSSYIIAQNVSTIIPSSSRIMARVPAAKIPSGIVASDFRLCRLTILAGSYTVGTSAGVLKNGDVYITQDAMDPQGEWILAYKPGSGANVVPSSATRANISKCFVGALTYFLALFAFSLPLRF